MNSFWNKTQRFFESKGWRIFWSLFVIVVFINLFVSVLHLRMNWYRVVLLVTIAILVIRRIIEIVQIVRLIKKDK